MELASDEIDLCKSPTDQCAFHLLKEQSTNKLLLLGFTFRESSRHRRTRLSDVVFSNSTCLWCYQTFMFMSPYHKVQEIVQHAFVYVVLWTVCYSARNCHKEHSAFESNGPVLMKNKNVKPFLSCFHRSHQFYFLLLKGSVKSLIANIS